MRQATRIANVFSLLGAFVVTSLVMGLLTAGLVLPAVGASGKAAQASVGMFNDLPSDFEVNPLNQQSRILAADGSVIATPYDENRIVVPLSRISPLMRQAQVAIEDKRFYEHGGVDPEGLARAVVSNVVSGGTQGASTLTQQYVKVVMQSQCLRKGDKECAEEAVSRSGTKGYLRKLQQLKYSVSLEGTMTKDQILAGYLNTVYFGDQQYGVEAAARHYFGVSASKLSLPQAALLAGVVQRPGATDPVHNPEAAVSRRNTVLQRMFEQKMITPEQYATARSTPLKLNITRFDQSCASSKYAYFCYYVQNWLLQQTELGKTPRERLQKLQGGGLTIRTSLDPKKMKILDDQIRKRVPVGNDEDVAATAIMVQPGTGYVQAMGQNTTFSNAKGAGKTSVNFAAPSGAGASLGFPIGSSAKLFAVVEALKQGHKVDGKVKVPRMNTRTDGHGTPAHLYTRRDFDDDCGLGRGEKWKVPNDHPVPAGPTSFERITGESVNTGFATLVAELGACKVWKTMTSMGLTKANGKPISPGPSNITLGTDSSTPLALANAYATVASGGKLCQPRPVVSIKDAKGRPVPMKNIGCKQVISPDVAAGTAKIFHGPFQKWGTAHAARLKGRDAMGKTGTGNQGIYTWFVGATPQLSTAVFVGHVNDAKPLTNLRLAGKFYDGILYASDIAAPIWKSSMDEALKGQPALKFDAPSRSMFGGDPKAIGADAASTQAGLPAPSVAQPRARLPRRAQPRPRPKAKPAPKPKPSSAKPKPSPSKPAPKPSASKPAPKPKPKPSASKPAPKPKPSKPAPKPKPTKS